MGDLCIGVDIGTTNVKAAVLDTQTHTVVASASAEHPLFHPRPGWAEQEADNYWRAVVHCIRACLSQGSDWPTESPALRISGLVGVTLPVDASGRPLHRAIIWMDARSERRVRRHPRARRRRADQPRQRQPDRAVVHRAEGAVAEEARAAASSRRRTSSCRRPATAHFGCPARSAINTGDAGTVLPLRVPAASAGTSTSPTAIGVPGDKYAADLPLARGRRARSPPAAAEETGLRAGTVVVAGGTDISSAALGVGVTEAGQAYYSMGTGSNLGIMIPTEQRVEEYRILKWPHVLPGLTMFDGPMAFTGASLKWFRDQFANPEALLAERMGQNVFDLVTAQAQQVPPGSDGLLYLPYLGNSLSPRWNTTACGVFFGVQPFTTRAHFIRGPDRRRRVRPQLQRANRRASRRPDSTS